MKLMDMIATLVGSLDGRPLFQSLVTNSGRKHTDLAFSHRTMSQWARS
jgi:hypothetical protein